MVKTSASSSWQTLYRALLRASAASVRFSRPAARNTRRYLRDEFASAILAIRDRDIDPTPPTKRGRGRPKLDRTRFSAGESSKEARKPPQTPTPTSDEVRDGLRHWTHNTLAFHLSASSLAGRSSRRFVEEQTPSSSHPTSPDVGLQNNTFAGESRKDTDPQSHVRHTFGSVERATNDQGNGLEVGTCAALTQPTKTARLAHRTIANLCSLTYHHLSPHTQMQSRAHLKDNRALRKPKKLSSLARVLGKLDSHDASNTDEPGLHDALNDHSHVSGSTGGSSSSSSEVLLNEAHMKLGFLQPTIKPKRGPISARLLEWDGQDPDRIGSQGAVMQMEADLEKIERLMSEYDAEQHQQLKVQRPRGGGGGQQMAKQVQQLRTEAEQLRKKIKTTTKALLQAEAQKQLDEIPIGHLADLVAAAQDAEGLLLGKNRWIRRKNGDFLPP